ALSAERSAEPKKQEHIVTTCLFLSLSSTRGYFEYKQPRFDIRKQTGRLACTSYFNGFYA
ncbi:hypothetical protein BaRGS_00012689, partial [Batillaria attramentaria]